MGGSPVNPEADNLASIWGDMAWLAKADIDYDLKIMLPSEQTSSPDEWSISLCQAGQYVADIFQYAIDQDGRIYENSNNQVWVQITPQDIAIRTKRFGAELLNLTINYLQRARLYCSRDDQKRIDQLVQRCKKL
jgi:hypothetical protein